MSHSIIYNPEESVIDMKIQGDLTLNDVREIISELIQVIKDQNCFLILNDMREATMKMSTLEIHGLPKTISDMLTSSGLSVHKFKRAFIAAKGLKDYEFFETVTINRGQFARLFFDMDEARKWLAGK